MQEVVRTSSSEWASAESCWLEKLSISTRLLGLVIDRLLTLKDARCLNGVFLFSAVSVEAMEPWFHQKCLRCCYVTVFTVRNETVTFHSSSASSPPLSGSWSFDAAMQQTLYGCGALHIQPESEEESETSLWSHKKQIPRLVLLSVLRVITGCRFQAQFWSFCWDTFIFPWFYTLEWNSIRLLKPEVTWN